MDTVAAVESGHLEGVAPTELALAPDHGTPDHLDGETQRPTGRREVKGAGGPEPENGEVLALRARGAEVEEVDLP